MTKLISTLGIIAMTAALALPSVVQACPWCKDAPSATNEDEDGLANAAAYNNSIYLMVSVPYFTFGVAALLIYKGMKRNEHFRRTSGGSDELGHASSMDNAASS